MTQNGGRIKILGVDFGDPYDISTFSGSSYYLWSTLKEKQALSDTFTPCPSLAVTLLFKGLSFRPSVRQWRATWRRSTRFREYLSSRARHQIRLGTRLDCNVSLQIGAYYDFAAAFDGPSCLLADNNCAISQRTNISFQSSRSVFRKQFDFEKRVYHSMDRIFCFSNFLASSMTRDFGCDESKVKVVYAGINCNVEKMLPSQGKDYSGKKILFVGFDFANKGGLVLLDAFKLVREKLPDAELVLLGPRLSRLPKGVRCLGSLSKAVPEESNLIAASFREASILVLPTMADAFPNTIREAMAAKLPCIATKISSIPEMIIEGETGFLIPVRQPRILARRILQLLTNQELCRRMGDAGFAHYQRLFTWDMVCDIMLKEINTLL